MKRVKCIGLIVLILIIWIDQTRGDCFSIVVGKDATEDGSVLFGHNEDNARKFVAGLRRISRLEHTDEERLILKNGFSIPQVKTTYGYWWLQMPERDHSDTFINEYGVVIASDNCQSREDKPELTDGGIGGPDLRRIIVERAQTAREGVELLGSLVEQYGYTASGRTFIICDANEGWFVAVVNGKHWVAQRVPDDKVAIVANSFSIREVSLSDKRNFLGASDLVTYAQKRGWYNPTNGPFSFEAAYSDPQTRTSKGNTHRQWSGLRLISKELVPPPEEEQLPFAVIPKEPIKVQNVTTVLRDHYENSPYEQNEKTTPAHKRHTSTICQPATNSSSIFQLRSEMPVEIGCVWWLALWQPCSTPYIPLYPVMNEVPEQISFGSFIEESCYYCTFSPEFGPAYQAFSDLTRWVNEDYLTRINPILAMRTTLEKDFFSNQEPFEMFVLDLWKKDTKKTQSLLTQFNHGAVSRAVGKALFIIQDVSQEVIILPR
ncbi:dipeptidase [Candidatus Latescibacterota bacterium]